MDLRWFGILPTFHFSTPTTPITFFILSSSDAWKGRNYSAIYFTSTQNILCLEAYHSQLSIGPRHEKIMTRIWNENRRNKKIFEAAAKSKAAAAQAKVKAEA